MTIQNKYGATVNLADYRLIEVVADITRHSRSKSVFHCTVIATRVFRDMYGQETSDTMPIRDFDSLLEAETFALRLRDAMPKPGSGS